MIDQKTIEEAKNKLVKAYDPLEIYLFGSYAWGTPTEDSDLDFLIVVDKSNEKTFRRPIIGYDALFGLGIPKDIIVYTKNEFENSSSNITSLIFKIKKEGEKIYAKA